MSEHNDEALPIDGEERDRLFEAACDRPMALCVSGGSDSMALMHLAAEWSSSSEKRSYWANWWEAQRLPHSNPLAGSIDIGGLSRPDWLSRITTREQLFACGGPPPLVVLSVDHGLREGSAAEAEFVAREAEKLGLPHQILQWTAHKPCRGLQEAAREARRRLILEVLRAESVIVGGFAHGEAFAVFRRDILLAHHLEDQAETFLMRLARGSGLEGLGGMRACGEVDDQEYWGQSQTAEYRVRRPFLGVSKTRLKSSLRARGAEWVEDPSNEDERFERVRVRRVMTLLEPLGFSAEKIASSARRLQDAGSGLECLAEQWRPLRWHCGLFGEIELEDRCLRGSYLLARTLRLAIRGFGGGAREAELAQLEKLAGLALDTRSRMSCGGLTLGGCKIEFVGKEASVIRIYREGKGKGLATVPLDEGRVVKWDGGRFTVSPVAGMGQGAVVRPLGVDGWAQLKRQVPELADLRWPAAAVATIPVIEKRGVVVAYSAIDEIMCSNEEDVRQSARDAWRASIGSSDGSFVSSFCGYRLDW